MVKNKRTEKAEPKKGMVGFFGSKSVEDLMKSRIGLLSELCTFDYIPFTEDIRAGLSQFSRYDVICRHKDGELILHYKINFDSSGRLVPDPISDNVRTVMLMKGL